MRTTLIIVLLRMGLYLSPIWQGPVWGPPHPICEPIGRLRPVVTITWTRS